MIVGTCRLRLHLPGSRSLKDKRQVVVSLCERLRRRFRVSAAEVGDLHLWDAATLAVAYVSAREDMCRQVLDELVRWIEGAGPYEVVEATVEMR